MRMHWPFAALATIGCALLFINLGSDYLWEDEGDTAVLASNIVRFGVPKAWDGVTFVDSDRGARVNNQLVMVSHPWVQYYLAAAAFTLFGEKTFAARLPFALAGWLTILVSYLAVFDLTKNRWAAFCSATLLTCSLQFLLYCRQCRYYSLSMFFGSLLLWSFFRMRSGRSCALFIFLGILSFHSHPFGIVFVSALGLMTLVYPPFAPQRRWFYLAGPVIAAFTVPWIAMAHHGYSENSQLVRSAPQFFGRLIQYLIECASITPLIGIGIVSILCGARSVLRRRTGDVDGAEVQAHLLDKNELGLLLVSFVTLMCHAVAIAATESTDELWDIGLRYTTIMIPLIAMTAGMLIIKISRTRVAIWLPLLLVFGFTKLAQLTPWIFWGTKVTTFDGKEVVEAHLPLDIPARFLNTDEHLMFLRDLWRENRGTVAKACEFLQKNATPGDRLIANYEWEPLYFHTRLPQALKILPEYPINEVARRNGLPNYVFGVDRVRWVIWRPMWEGYVGYSGEKLEQQILAGNARVQPMARLEETIWENRPEVHHHRFSDNKYFFTAPKNLPAAEIFRIDWPASN